jgi:hypothetical protein
MVLSVINGAFLTLKSVSLGRLVVDTVHPGQDFWPESPFTFGDNEVDERPFDNLKNALKTTKHATVRAKLSRIIHGDIGSHRSSYDELVTPQSKVYSLLQPISHFRRLCQDTGTRDWIERTLKHCPIFLVVGLVTVTQAKVGLDQHQSTHVSTDVSIPVTEIVTHGVGAVLPPGVGDVLNVGVGVTAGQQKAAAASFIAPGERVIGVQYRKVKFELFSSDKVGTSSLENNPNRWVMLLGGDRGGDQDILEADLEETMTPDDLELEVDSEVIEGDREDEEIVFIDEQE